jgi:hypothetical protein
MQVIAGCILSIPAYHLAGLIQKGKKCPPFFELIVLFSFAVLGMLLPLGVHGLLPIIITLAASGVRLNLIIPALASNALFNTQILFSGYIYSPEAYIGQILSALIAGMAVGMILRLSSIKHTGIFRNRGFGEPVQEGITLKSMAGNISSSILYIGPYLLIGSIINVLVQRYLIREIMTFVYMTSLGYGAANFFMQRNASINHIFNCVVNIAAMFMNFTLFSTLIAVLRARAVLFFYLYYSLLAGVLTAAFLLISR